MSPIHVPARRHLRLARLSLSFLFSSVAGITAAHAAPYVFTSFDVPFPGTVHTSVGGINDSGEIAGSYVTPELIPPCDGANTQHGFLLIDGSFSTFEFTGPCVTDFQAINNQGAVVGDGIDLGGGGNASFLFENGQFSNLNVPGEFTGGAFGINNAGHIVGETFISGATMGFLLEEGSFSFFSVPGAFSTHPRGIDDAGDIVGTVRTCGTPCNEQTEHGFLLTGGVFSTIDFPGASSTSLLGINDAGDIIGIYDEIHSFIVNEQGFSTIEFPGASYKASGINDPGEIVGTYQDHNGFHGFVGRPASVVSGLVHLDSMSTSFDGTPVTGGPAGTFTIEASFTNTSSTPIDTPQFVVTALSNGNLLLNADVPRLGVGARLTPDVGDGVLEPGESLDLQFVIGLQQRRTFTFRVGLLGVNGP